MMQNNTDVWLMDLVRGAMMRFTFDPAIDTAPLWSPDGTRIAFVSGRKGPYNLYLKSSSGAGAEELLLETKSSPAGGLQYISLTMTLQATQTCFADKDDVHRCSFRTR